MLKGINSWIASEVFAKLLAKLDVPEDGGSTYLDNSLVYWGNELGFNHIAYSVPCLLAGSAGGFIKPGRYLDYIDWDGRAYFSQEDGNVIKGIPHNQFLVTALQAMGLSPADYERGRQGRLRLHQRQRPHCRHLGRRLRSVDGRPGLARHGRLRRRGPLWAARSARP